jgi:type IV secretory pathway VirB10-like protein
MKILTMTLIMALPLMALGQAADQQAPKQGQEAEVTAPAKAKKKHAPAEATKTQTKPEMATGVHGQTKARSHAPEMNKTEAGTRSSTSRTSPKSTSQTKVNVQEFKSRHSEVFNLGRHPKEFFIERFGANHFRLIGNTYFVFVDGCWVAVDVAGFTFVDRVICEGDPDFIVVY